jgi:hypothetical protein
VTAAADAGRGGPEAENSNDWQRLINDYVTSDANRAEIRALISPPAPAAPAAAPPPPGARGTPAQRTHFLATWQPEILYYDRTYQVLWTVGATVRYASGPELRGRGDLPGRYQPG